MEIISNHKALTRHVEATLKMYQAVGLRLHVAIISAIWHAATYGNAAVLNRIFEGLRSNDQMALKLYVRRISAINGMVLADGGLVMPIPDGLPAEMVKEYVINGGVLGFEKGQFTIKFGHTSAEAKQLAILCSDRFINPDGEKDRFVLDRNNFAEVKTLGDVEVIEQLAKQVKQALGADTETKRHALSEATRKFLSDLGDTLSIRKNQLTLDAG